MLSQSNSISKPHNYARESFKDVLLQIGNHFIITTGHAFSSAAAYLGIISFLAPVEWFLIKIVIGSSVAWWTWSQSKDYFIEKSPIRDAYVQNEKDKDNSRSYEQIYFVGPKKYLNWFFKIFSILIFLAVCAAAFFPSWLPILGPAGVIAKALSLEGTISTMPYWAAGLGTITYISQSIFYAVGRLAVFGYNKLVSALDRYQGYKKLSEINSNIEIMSKMPAPESKLSHSYSWPSFITEKKYTQKTHNEKELTPILKKTTTIYSSQ